MMAMNWWAVLASAVVMHIIGWLWYGPLFGKLWQHLSGITPSGEKKGMGKAIVWGLLASLVMSVVINKVLEVTPNLSAWCGAAVGATLWLGFVATTQINSVLYEKKSMKLFALNAGYYLVTMAIAGVILAAWR